MGMPRDMGVGVGQGSLWGMSWGARGSSEGIRRGRRAQQARIWEPAMRTGTGALNMSGVAQGAGAPAQAKRRETALGTVRSWRREDAQDRGQKPERTGREAEGEVRELRKGSARLPPRAWKSTGFAEPKWPELEDGARLWRV